ncbi:src substrate protein p85-like isoform X2 [Synchiropus splendidus]|uniref:src substrate protein p85-like isoform X2 n=1 Tax=Synchiropus splendidus TaxID=270530 RepID=UPI00237E5AAE|nr:src substrate protein p85-like isoform X2 [Synchiropus splendidus]
MWKSTAGHSVSVKASARDDDWETDPDFENDVSEQEQRWGAKTIEGSGRKEPISVAELRHTVASEHEQGKQKEQTPKASYGYGGKFGVERDRMDKAAVGHDYVARVEQHSSQKDAARGFGGKYGVQQDRVDKSALTFDYKGVVQKHASQRDYSKGFGGRFGVEREKVDKSALGFDYKGETEKHESQRDYSAGFGGRYGVQKDRMDKSAAAFSDMDSPSSAYEKTQPFEASSSGAGKLKAQFESLARASDRENLRRVEEERARRRARERSEREEALLRQQELEEDVPQPEEEDVPQPEEEDVPQPEEEDVPQPEEEARPELQPHTREVEELPEIEEEPEYDDVPPLPPRAQDSLDALGPPLPTRCSDGEELYEDVLEAPPPAPSDGEPDYEDTLAGLTATALYDYTGEGDDELSFYPDDVITNIEMIDEGWWRGQCRGHFGLFPAAYVQLH